VVNGVVLDDDARGIRLEMRKKQENALKEMPEFLKGVETYYIPLRSYDMNSLENIKVMLKSVSGKLVIEDLHAKEHMSLKEVAEEIRKDGTRVLFTMGKGGVGKTTMASALALYLSKEGMKVHLTTTDPANHLSETLSENENLVITAIDEEAELASYREEVLSKAVGASQEDIDYIEEDLRSPCTQEIAVFRKFAKIVKGSEEDIVIIDTAPTGHTLLLLDTTESYHKEVERSHGDIPDEVRELLPRLRNPKETKVIIVALPEPTPFHEAKRLQEDLKRADIHVSSWIVNQSLLLNDTEDQFLREKSEGEKKWINTISDVTDGRYTQIPWIREELKEEGLLRLFQS